MNLRAYSYWPLVASLQWSGTTALKKKLVQSSPPIAPHDVPKTDVRLTLSSSRSEFAADESILVEVTLSNDDADRPAQLLDWVVPCDVGDDDDGVATDMSFFRIHTAGGIVPPYKGASLKRGRPDNTKDFIVLAPGEQISCAIDLGKYYDFSAPGDDNDYVIRYSATRLELTKDPKDGEDADQPAETLQSNALELKIDAREFRSRRGARLRPLLGGNLRGREGATAFNGCDESQQALLLEARPLALAATTEVVDRLAKVGEGASSAACPQYERWFGSFDSVHHAEIEAGYEAIRASLESQEILFDCTTCDRDIFAYVYPDDPYEVFLCKLFWTNSEMTGSDSKPGVLVHEMSHFAITADTGDEAYGKDDSSILARTDPADAVDNADNHEYMAENTPAYECFADDDDAYYGGASKVEI